MKFTALLPKQRRALAAVAVVAALAIPLSAGPSAAVQVCNTTPIVFTPPPQATFAVLPLAPYPSTINVTGFSGTITDVNVLLNDLTYSFPEDLDVLVVHPDGTSVLVMSDVGGDNNVQRSTSDVDLVLDQQAPNPLPADGQLVSGTFRPVDDDDDPNSNFPVDTFPAPAPAIGGTDLNVFNGKTANGTWRLYVVDDEPGPPVVQDIGGGWCLDILTTGGPTTTSGPTTTGGPTTTRATTSTTQATTSTTQATTSTTQATTSTTQATTTTTRVTTTTTTTAPTTTSSSTTTSTTPGSCGGLTPTIVGTGAGETIDGTSGPDVIAGGGGSDTINGLGGDDTICGGDGNDAINGGDGNDRLFGDAGNDRLTGGNGDDALNGGAALDQCFGDAGTDTAAACEQVFTTP